MRTTILSVLSAGTLFALASCTKVYCLDNERKVGAVCSPLCTTQTVDAAATATGDAGRSDSGSPLSTLDGAVGVDGATEHGDADPPDLRALCK